MQMWVLQTWITAQGFAIVMYYFPIIQQFGIYPSSSFVNLPVLFQIIWDWDFEDMCNILPEILPYDWEICDGLL